VAEYVTVKGSRFNGVIRLVQIDIALGDKDYYLPP
jgi:hypothetical protein